MMTKRSALQYSIGCALAVLSGSVAASGLASAKPESGMYAGEAGVGSAMLSYNPAELSRLPSFRFVVAQQDILPPPAVAEAGTVRAKGAAVPDAYFVADVDDRFKLGLSVNSPGAAQKNYDSTWIARFQARPDVQAVNLQPSVAYQLSDAVSVDAGISYQSVMWDGVLTNGREGDAVFVRSDRSYGYNLGTLINIDAQTSVGLAYRSQMKHSLAGALTFIPGVLSGGGDAGNGGASLPDTFSSSVMHQLDSHLDLLADVTWTGWGAYQNPEAARGGGMSPESRKNAWRASLGATQRYGELWTGRLGLTYDQTPTSDASLVDRGRTWFALGGQYKFASDSSLDFGYAHVFVNGADANRGQSATAGGALPGTVSNDMNLYSLQYGHRF